MREKEENGDYLSKAVLLLSSLLREGFLLILRGRSSPLHCSTEIKGDLALTSRGMQVSGWIVSVIRSFGICDNREGGL